MFDKNEKFYILGQQISGNRACIHASDFGHKRYNIRKTLSCFGDRKKLNLWRGAGMGPKKV